MYDNFSEPLEFAMLKKERFLWSFALSNYKIKRDMLASDFLVELGNDFPVNVGALKSFIVLNI